MIAATANDFDELSISYCTPNQLAGLDEMPARLPFLTMSDLIGEGLRTRKAHDIVVRLICEVIEDPGDRDAAVVLMQRALAGEYLLRRSCFIIADELERRRTGVAPRAKRIN